MRDFILTSLIAMIASLFCIQLLRPLAVRINFVDRPSQRKLHENETPLIGGIVIFFGFCFAMLFLHASLMPYRSLFMGGALLVLIGVVDDFRDLSARLRLFGQVMVGLIMTAWGGLLINQLGNLFNVGNIYLGLWALPFTVLVVVGYINAFNMIDGQDGLAGCVALVQSFWLILFAWQLQLSVVIHILIILMILLFVFLNFNMRFPWRIHPSIFLGDSGSTFLSFVLAWVAIMLSQSNNTVVRPVAILWVMALPSFDLINVISFRLRQRKSIFAPGRDHVHHILYERGINRTVSTVLLGLLQFTLAGIGYIFNYFHVSDAISFMTFLIVFISYFFIITWIRTPVRRAETEELSILQ